MRTVRPHSRRATWSRWAWDEGRGRTASSAGRCRAAVLAWPGPRGMVGAPVPRRAVSQAPRRSTQIGGAMEIAHVTESVTEASDHSGLDVREAAKHGAYVLKAECTLNGGLTATGSRRTSGLEGAR